MAKEISPIPRLPRFNFAVSVLVCLNVPFSFKSTKQVALCFYNGRFIVTSDIFIYMYIRGSISTAILIEFFV